MKKTREKVHYEAIHALPAFKLSTFSTSFTTDELREFRRPKISFSSGQQNTVIIPKSQGKKRESSVDLETWGKKKEDFSLKEGNFTLLEYSTQEYPEVFSAPGMVGQIVNYYRRRNMQDTGKELRNFRFGARCLLEDTQELPFLGFLSKGKVLLPFIYIFLFSLVFFKFSQKILNILCFQTVRMLENKMYSAPVVEHSPPSNTFLLVRDRKNPNSFTLRMIPSSFSVGQEQLDVAINTPAARATPQLVKQRLQVIFYFLFFYFSSSF